jgi:hypothetical protein
MRVFEILASSAPLLGAVVVLVAAGESSAAPGTTACLQVVERRASHAIVVRSRCGETVDVKLCLEKSDHTWACEAAPDPGK